jgi:hypothetical protein
MFVSYVFWAQKNVALPDHMYKHVFCVLNMFIHVQLFPGGVQFQNQVCFWRALIELVLKTIVNLFNSPQIVE